VTRDADVVAWRTPALPRARSLLAGYALGAGLVVATGAVLLLGRLVAGGVPAAPLALAGLLALVGGPISLLYLYLGYRVGSASAWRSFRESFADGLPSRDDFDARIVAVATAGTVATVVAVAPPPLSLLTTAFVATFLLVNGRRAFELDPAEAELTTRYPRFDHERTRRLDSVVAVRSLPLGPVALVVFSGRGSVAMLGPRPFLVPRETASAVREAAEAVIERTPPPDRAGRVERAVVAALGLGFLAVAPAALAVGAGDGAVLLAAVCVPFGLLFLGIAAVV